MPIQKPPTDPDPLELFNLGSIGVIKDLKPHLIPPEAFSNGRNIRFDTSGVGRFLDFAPIFTAFSGNPEFIFNIPTPAVNFWLYATLNKLYVYDGSTHTDVTRASGGDYTLSAGSGHNWQGTILGGVPLVNNGSDVPQYWTGLDTGHKFKNLDDWPDDLRAKVLRAFGPYLVAGNLSQGSDLLQKTLQWSGYSDPGTIPPSWDYTDPTQDAGRTQLTDDKGGEIEDMLLLGDNMIIYCSNSMHVLKYVGGTAIFSPQLLLKESGILAKKCACNFNKGTAQAVITQDDIIVHAGTQSAQSIVEDKNRKQIFNEIDTANFGNSFSFENAKAKEVWFCYPSTGNVIPNVAMVWSYKNNTCTFRDFTGVSVDFGTGYNSDDTTWAQDTGTWDDGNTESWNTENRNVLVAVSNTTTQAFQIDAVNDPTVPSFIERTGISFDGKDRQGQPKASTKTVKQLNRMWIKTTGTGVLLVRTGSQETIDGPVTWTDPQQFDCATDIYLDWTTVGKLLAYRIDSNDGQNWQVQGIDLEIEVLSQL